MQDCSNSSALALELLQSCTKPSIYNWLHYKETPLQHDLTQWSRVTNKCVSKLDHHWLRQWLVACLEPSHYLNKWWQIVNWTLINKFQWNFIQNTAIFIQEKGFYNVVYKMADILSWPESECVKEGSSLWGKFIISWQSKQQKDSLMEPTGDHMNM